MTCSALAVADQPVRFQRVDAPPPGFLSQRECLRRLRRCPDGAGSVSRDTLRKRLYRMAVAAVGGEFPPVLVGRTLYLHPSTLPATAALPLRVVHADRLSALADDRRALVLCKVRVVTEWLAHQRRETQRVGATTALRNFVAGSAGRFTYTVEGKVAPLEFGERSLRRWTAAYQDEGVDGLCEDGRGRYERERVSPAMESLYWGLRMDPKKLSITACWRIVAAEAEKAGLAWFKSAAVCRAWDNRTRDDRALIYHREGERAWMDKCAPYAESDEESYAVGACFVGDNHTCDFWCKSRDGSRVIRPVLSMWQDVRSRTCVGWRLTEAGNEHSLLLAMRDAADRFTLPFETIVDNGRDFSAWSWRGDTPKHQTRKPDPETVEQINGLYAVLGITPRWATPYHPQSKAIERAFLTLEQGFKPIPSYAGNCPKNKPGEHAQLVERAVTWDEAAESVRKVIDQFNNTPSDVLHGYTPLQIMATAEHKRVVPDSLRDLLLLTWHRPIAAGRNGVGIRIVSGHTTRYGQLSPELRAMRLGEKVRVGYDPEDISSVSIFTMDYRFVCRAEANKKINRAMPTEALRNVLRVRATEKRRLKKAREVGLEHFMDPLDRAVSAAAKDAARRRKPDPPAPAGGAVLEPVRGPIEAPEKPLRKAVGAEHVPEHESESYADFHRQFTAAARAARAQQQAKPAETMADELRRWSRELRGSEARP